MKPNLILLTNEFPATSANAENWLYDELNVSHTLYNNIYIIPDKKSNTNNNLPINCSVIEWNINSIQKLTLLEILNCLSIVCSDFVNYPSKVNYCKAFRYNLSLIKNLHIKAKKIAANANLFSDNTILYAYWADNLATTACIISQKHKTLPIVTRGHGFEIFEEQTKYGVIPFRSFQYKYLSKIYADSIKGYKHLNFRNKRFDFKNAYSYVGTQNHGFGIFSKENIFTIATCSFIRNVKRLQLMPEILKHINFPLVWHVLGNGEDLENLKELCMHLPKNINVIFHGALSNENILNFYKNNHINIFCSLSSSEGLPVSMMEAQSFGIPIMSTNVGGCNEICNNETGFLIEKYFNPKDVAEKLENFKNSAKNTIQFHEKCRLYWEQNFNAEKNYKNFAKTITELVQ